MKSTSKFGESRSTFGGVSSAHDNIVLNTQTQDKFVMLGLGLMGKISHLVLGVQGLSHGNG